MIRSAPAWSAALRCFSKGDLLTKVQGLLCLHLAKGLRVGRCCSIKFDWHPHLWHAIDSHGNDPISVRCMAVCRCQVSRMGQGTIWHIWQLAKLLL